MQRRLPTASSRSASSLSARRLSALLAQPSPATDSGDRRRALVLPFFGIPLGEFVIYDRAPQSAVTQNPPYRMPSTVKLHRHTRPGLSFGVGQRRKSCARASIPASTPASARSAESRRQWPLPKTLPAWMRRDEQMGACLQTAKATAAGDERRRVGGLNLWRSAENDRSVR